MSSYPLCELLVHSREEVDTHTLAHTRATLPLFLCRSVFGNIVGPNPLKGENTGTQYYEGIRVRSTPAPITYPSQTAAVAINTAPIQAINATPVKVLPAQQRTVKNISPAPDSTALADNPASGTQTTPITPASPILKAQLSAPPKPPSNTPSQSQNPVTKVDSKSQVGPSPNSLYRSLCRSFARDLGSSSHFLVVVAS